MSPSSVVCLCVVRGIRVQEARKGLRAILPLMSSRLILDLSQILLAKNNLFLFFLPVCIMACCSSILQRLAMAVARTPKDSWRPCEKTCNKEISTVGLVDIWRGPKKQHLFGIEQNCWGWWSDRLGWVDREFSSLLGHFRSYLLPKQSGGTSLI